MRNRNDWSSLTGTIRESNSSGKYKILRFVNTSRILVEFVTTGYKKYCKSKEVLNGSIKDPYHPSVQGVGYLGEGPYTTSYIRNGKKVNSPAYTVWGDKLKCCYGKSINRHLYTDVEFCKEWLCFQNFAKWFYEQEKLYGKGGHVDKDLLFLGNREYSPHTCVYVPPAVNSLFTGSSERIEGVSWFKDRQKWAARLQRGELTAQGKKKLIHLGSFDVKEDATAAYYSAKLAHVKSVALKYQDQIHPALFYKLYHGTENYLNYYM